MRALKPLTLIFPALLLLASFIAPIAQAATVTFNFSKSLDQSFSNIPVATLTISDVPGGATKWTLGANWNPQYGSAFLQLLEYEYRGNTGLTASDYRVTTGKVTVPSFDFGSARTRVVKFQTDNEIDRFNTGESVSWIFANTKAEDFSVNYVQINAINHGADVRFSTNTAAPPITPPAGTVSRDFTNTVAGIDNNQNGVRDDIEDFIGKTYTDPKQRAAMMQYAASEQSALLHSTTKDNAFEAAKRTFRALDCTREVFGKSSSKLTLDVLAMTLNTKQRALAYADANKLSSGQVYDMFVKNPCDAQ